MTSKDPTDIKKNFRLHLHCWHTNDPFSKFAFKVGKYNEIKLSTLVSDTSASGYVSMKLISYENIFPFPFQAMRMALESQSMTLEQLKQKLLDIKK